MLHDLGAMAYRCEFDVREPNPATDYLVSCMDDLILFDGDSLPSIADTQTLVNASAPRYLFSISEHAFFLAEDPIDLPSATDNDSRFVYESVSKLRQVPSQWMAFAGATGYHLAVWYRRNRFCGACGMQLDHSGAERALVCPACGNTVYPTISPAVIVGIVDGDRILLTRYATGYSRYALVAGFAEIGETLEGTVRREIHEEVGLDVKNIRYFDNQPWGFSQSLLVGFFADLDGSPEVLVDDRELSEARWVARSDMPESDAHVSLTATMMEAFRLGLVH